MNARLSSALRAPFALLAAIAMALGLLVASVSLAGSAQAASSGPNLSLNLPDGQVGKAYLSPPAVSGGKAPYRFSSDTYRYYGGWEGYYYVGATPEGLKLNGKGQLAGRPTQAGCYELDVYVTDSRGNTDYDYGYFTIRNRNGSLPACAMNEA